VYDAKILRGEPMCLGAYALRWATVDEMKALPFCEADVPLLNALARK
jgi:8-oxo-dGTP diphosphatase